MFINVVIPKHNQTTDKIEKENGEIKKHINKSNLKHKLIYIYSKQKKIRMFVIKK
jgi:hypothetical protein